MGHSIQVLSLLVAAGTSFFAVPLAGRIHEGVKFSNRDQRTLPTKFANLLDALAIAEPIYLVADAYYACQQIALRLLRNGSHLISRVRRSTAAYQPVPLDHGPRRRGRPRLYGQKVKLWDGRRQHAGQDNCRSPVGQVRRACPSLAGCTQPRLW